jgi:PIN domain nuclease of toxin-antitoxin system
VDTATEIGVSAISAWEVATLEQRGRITLDRPAARWVRAALTHDPRIVELPVDAGIAVRAASLADEGLPGDPADRLIYATAVQRGGRLITKDRTLRTPDRRRTVW